MYTGNCGTKVTFADSEGETGRIVQGMIQKAESTEERSKNEGMKRIDKELGDELDDEIDGGDPDGNDEIDDYGNVETEELNECGDGVISLTMTIHQPRSYIVVHEPKSLYSPR